MTFVSRLFLVLLATLFATQALARPDSRRMTCAQIQSYIKQNGSVLFTTGEFTYDTYVADSRFCGRNSRPAPAKIPSADKKKCVVDYQCRKRMNDSN